MSNECSPFGLTSVAIKVSPSVITVILVPIRDEFFFFPTRDLNASHQVRGGSSLSGKGNTRSLSSSWLGTGKIQLIIKHEKSTLKRIEAC